MKTVKKVFLTLIVHSLALGPALFTPPAYAEIPEFITYQGYIVDSGGEPLSGPFDVTFRIYESETAEVGEEIWLETQAGVPFSEGDFQCEIGKVSAQSATPLRNLAFDQPYWLGIEIASLGELSPKQALDAVPFAYRVRNGVTTDEDQTITGDKTFEGTITLSGGLVSGSIPPIGTVVAWHKSMPGMPALPEEWVECNGQTVNDVESPLNGHSVPDLNNTGRFLKGSNTSGVATNAQAHTHDVPHDNWVGSQNNNPPGDINLSRVTFDSSGAIQDQPTRPAVAPDPSNLTVVWVMRIK